MKNVLTVMKLVNVSLIVQTGFIFLIINLKVLKILN